MMLSPYLTAKKEESMPAREGNEEKTNTNAILYARSPLPSCTSPSSQSLPPLPLFLLQHQSICVALLARSVLPPNETREGEEEKRINANGESPSARRAGEGIYNKDERTSIHPPFGIALGSAVSVGRHQEFLSRTHAKAEEFDIPQSTFNEWLSLRRG